MMIIDMSDLLEEWEAPITVMVPSAGSYEAGRWVPGRPVPQERLATVVPLSSDDLRNDENGRYTVQDIKVYTRFPIEEGEIIGYQDREYKITEPKDYSAHSNVYVYIAKRIKQGVATDMG